MIGLAHLPEDSSIPICFEHNAAFPGLPADKAIRLFNDFSIVKQSASFSQIAGVAGWIRHLPSVDHVAVNVDQVNFATAALRREQSIAGKRTVAITGAKADASTLSFNLLYSGISSPPTRL